MTNDYETLNKLKDYPVFSNDYKRHTEEARSEFRDKINTFTRRFGEPSIEHIRIISKKVCDKHQIKSMTSKKLFAVNFNYRQVGLPYKHMFYGTNLVKTEQRIVQWTNMT